MPDRFASHLALPALASILLAAPGDDLTLRREPLAEGVELQLYSEVAYELDFELSAAGDTLPGFEMGYERTTEKTVTVLEPGRDGPEAIRVVYHVLDELGEGPGIDGCEEIRTESPLDGQVVSLRRDGRGWTVRDGEGDELDTDLAELVIDEEVRRDELLFDLRLFGEATDGVELDVGVTLDVDEDFAIELLDAAIDEDGGVFEEAEMILAFTSVDEHPESGRRCAVFDVELVAQGEIPGDLEVAVELSGELWLDLRSACVTELELDGEMAVAGDSEDTYGVELEGEGSFRLVLRAF